MNEINNGRYTVGQVYDIIDTTAPFSTQLEWDNSGVIIGSRADRFDKVLVCLDASANAVSEAVKRGCKLIVSHHPLIFRAIKSVPSDSEVYAMIRAGIALISAHTNLDLAPRGVNYALAQAIRLSDIHRIEQLEIGFGGELEEAVTADALAKAVASALGRGVNVRYTPSDRPIKRVGLCGGSGGDMARQAYELGYDAFVTGEVRLHEFVDARNGGFCVVEAGHHETEAAVLEYLCELLREGLPGAEVIRFNEAPALCTAGE